MQQKLQWIEFGSMPYFYLTYESALKLRDTYTDELFSSTYADWEPVMLETCKEFATNLASVKGQRMVGHEVVSHMVRKVTYENGVSIYVNYSDKAETVEGVTIQPKSYLVTGGER